MNMQTHDYSNIRVVIVDGMLFWRDLIRNFLNELGIRHIRCVSNAKKSWTTIREFQPHVVICDWKLPDGSGLELLRLIRHADESPNRFLNVMMVTAYNEQHRVHAALRAGVNTYITKPTSAQAFMMKFATSLADERPFEIVGDYFGPPRNHAFLLQ